MNTSKGISHDNPYKKLKIKQSLNFPNEISNNNFDKKFKISDKNLKNDDFLKIYHHYLNNLKNNDLVMSGTKNMQEESVIFTQEKLKTNQSTINNAFKLKGTENNLQENFKDSENNNMDFYKCMQEKRVQEKNFIQNQMKNMFDVMDKAVFFQNTNQNFQDFQTTKDLTKENLQGFKSTLSSPNQDFQANFSSSNQDFNACKKKSSSNESQKKQKTSDKSLNLSPIILIESD